MKNAITFLALWLLIACGTHAQPHSLPLSASTQKVSSAGSLSVFRMDAAAADKVIDPSYLVAEATWRPLPGMLSLGFSSDTVWLKLTVSRDAQAPADWVLNLDNAILDDVQLFYRHAGEDGADQGVDTWMHLRAGENLPRDAWPMDVRNAAFMLTLPAGETTLLLRIKSKNALASTVTLWQSQAFNDYSRRDMLFNGLYFGGFLVLLVLHGFFWRVTKEPQSGWYLLYLVLSVGTQILSAGLPQWIFRLPVEVSDTVLGCCMCLAMPVSAQFAIRQLELASVWPRISKMVMRVTMAAGFTGAALTLTGCYELGASLVQPVMLATLVLMSGCALLLWRRGHQPARFFVFAFGVYYVAIGIAILRNLGWLPVNVFTVTAPSVGSMIHLLAISMRLHFQFDVLRARASAAQELAMHAVRQMNEGLEAEVALRTAELRDALATERQIKEEQRGFVAMVSHEFHTPLAIISMTAQQIARSAGATWSDVEGYCWNLRSTVQRMQTLVDSYLSADRMDSAVFSPRPYSVTELLDELEPQWPPGRLTVKLEKLPQPFAFDPGLLKIALQNLLANADRHAPRGEVIALLAKAEARTLDNGVCNGLRVNVSNGGEAIPSEDASRLFEKYFRGREAHHRTGAGLGLYLVQRIARMHDGTAWLEEAGMNGRVTFSIWIPARLPRSKPQPNTEIKSFADAIVQEQV